MLEWLETAPVVNVQESEYQRLLGFPRNHTLDGRVRELADAARRWYAQNGRPWFYAREASELQLVDGKLRIGKTEFSSQQLHDQFAEARAHSAVLLAVSAGRECEEHARQLWRESKPDEYFFLEMFGSAVVECLVTVASGFLCHWADQVGLAILPHYSPGYTGWDVSDQLKLWNLFHGNGTAAFGGKLDVLETGMLWPKKSLLAVCGITRHLDEARQRASLIPCDRCSLQNCQYRRSAYQHPLRQIEDVRALLSGALETFSGPEPAVLKRDARYATNTRALEKWSKERLRLNFKSDGAVEAVFRYEGSTCSNMGRTLEFDYRVTLAPREEHYRILELNCAPADGDTGHQFQCEYLNDPKGLMRQIGEEKPLLGRPLKDVLSWRREYDPSACYCDATRREHKWGLAFEVIHFALTHRHEESPMDEPAEF